MRGDAVVPREELEMREFSAPTPETAEELAEFVSSLVNREHDYGTCVYAMSIAAVAAFNFVAHKLGVTGFQASCADLDILRRVRHLKGPFILLDGENLLYPQYDLRARVDEWIKNTISGWANEEAKKLLAEKESMTAGTVREHWERLASVPAKGDDK